MRLRNLAAGLALLVTGTVIGVTTQQFASADISTGDRPVLVPIESCRLLDTRPDFNVGPRATPLGPGETYNVDTQQADTECTGNIPTEATALAINLTALNATENGFITTWAEGNRPNGSTLNPAPGQLVFNAATVQLANDNTFQIYNENGTVDIIIDVIGYYENHNHDDRYYTETEIDAAIQAAVDQRLPVDSTMVPIARFRIDVGGTVATVEFRPPLTGPPTAVWNFDRWEVTLPGEPYFFSDQHAFCTSVGSAERFVSVSSSSPELLVYVSDITGAPAESQVYCTVYGDVPTP